MKTNEMNIVLQRSESSLPRFLISTALAGAFLISSAAWAQTGDPGATGQQPSPSSIEGQLQTDKTQLKTDREARKKQHQLIKQDRAKLQADKKQFGVESEQVKADRAQLKKDIQALRGDRRQNRKDRHKLHKDEKAEQTSAPVENKTE